MGKGPKNDDERCAENWLRQQMHQDCQWLLDDPPDLLIDGFWAVEVTRLNQRLLVGDDKRSIGEEEARIPLTQCLEEVIFRLGPPGNEGKSWVIDCEYDFREPLPSRKTVAAQASEALVPLSRPYDDSTVSAMHRRYVNYDRHSGETSFLEFPHLCLECGICLDLGEFSHDPATFFVRPVSDGEGISIATELAGSIRNRIEHKSHVVRRQNRIGNYENWWLILIDHVSHLPIQALSDREQAFVRDQDFEFWSRVTIVSSLDAPWHYDLITTVSDRVNSSLARPLPGGRCG